MNAPEPSGRAVAQSIPLVFIRPSPTNPRKHFDPAALEELTASVRKHGIIQPVLVRGRYSVRVHRETEVSRWYAQIENIVGNWNFQGTGHATREEAEKEAAELRNQYELVAGERRYRAAKAAGIDEIPAIVRSLTDAEALELQVIENLQREDLHPLEEAEGYELLMKQHDYTAEDLAAKVGKSKAYVYARLKLTALTAKGRAAFFDGKLNPSTALLIARIPVPALQDEALKEITATGYQGEPRHGVRSAAQYLQHHYMLRLADAPFPCADASLVPKAGTCAACPKRTGNQPELFGDVKGADVCTDPSCFDAKKTAHLARARAAAEAKGQQVITGKPAKKIIPYGNVDDRSGFYDLDAKNYADPKNRTYRELLGKACPLPTLVESDAGKLVEVVARKDVGELLKDKLPKQAAGNDNDEQKKREARARLETNIRGALFDAIAAGHPGTMTPADASLIAGQLFDRTDHECTKRVLKHWEPEAFAKAKVDQLWNLKKTLAKRIALLPPPDLVRLMVDLALAGEVHVGSYSGPGKPELLIATAERLAIDHAAIRSKLTAEARAKAAPKSKAKSSPRKPLAPVKAKRKASAAPASA